MPSPPLKSSLTVFHLPPDSSSVEEPDGREASAERARASPPGTLSQIQEVNETPGEEKARDAQQAASGQGESAQPQLLPKIQTNDGNKESESHGTTISS